MQEFGPADRKVEFYQRRPKVMKNRTRKSTCQISPLLDVKSPDIDQKIFRPVDINARNLDPRVKYELDFYKLDINAWV